SHALARYHSIATRCQLSHLCVRNQTMTFKAKAWKSGVLPSDVANAAYLISGAAGAGDSHSLAVKPDGSVWSWGLSSWGRLGRSTSGSYSASPGQVPIADVVAVTGGSDFSLALKRDGTVWSWGDGYLGELGNGSSN